MPAPEAAPLPGLELGSIRPVTSTFSPTCFESSSDFPSRTYDVPVPDMPADDDVPVVAALDGVELAPEVLVLLPELIVAFASTNSLREEELDAVPVVAALVPGLPLDDVSPCWRHPVTVTEL